MCRGYKIQVDDELGFTTMRNYARVCEEFDNPCYSLGSLGLL
jgi:hypothetical protein